MSIFSCYVVVVAADLSGQSRSASRPVGVDDHIDPSRSAIPGTLLIWDWSEVAQAFRHPMVVLIILLAGIPAGGLTFCAHRK